MQDLPGLTEDDMAMYMEADIFANPHFPNAALLQQNNSSSRRVDWNVS